MQVLEDFKLEIRTFYLDFRVLQSQIKFSHLNIYFCYISKDLREN